MRWRMAQRTLPVLMVCILLIAHSGATKNLAARPPMGWNSWDAYGLTIDESQFRANAQVLAGLKNNHGWGYGWSYAVIDEGWYLENPLARAAEFKYSLDAYGRLIPDPKRFPSTANGAGFKPLADWVHRRGLKFGIHILRGIPRGALRDNLPVAKASFHAADVADTGDTCPWDAGNYGVRNTPAGQAYYDSVIGLYARWGVDFLKVDCIADHPYKADEIRMIAIAIRKSGRAIVLSLSPGPTNLSHAAEVGQYSQMWRVADDIWDGWEFLGQRFPNGLLSAFDNLAKWEKFAKSGNWPDADMLPWGSLTPHPGWGPPRQSRLTHDEQRTQFTLWAMARSPLILGGDLTKLDDFTRSLLTNEELIAIDQGAGAREEIPGSPEDMARFRVWTATFAGGHTAWLAVFNLQDAAVRRDIPWPASLTGKKYKAIFDIWNLGRVVPSEPLHVNLPPHGCALFLIADFEPRRLWP
jgi:alpha-galactosidase